MPGRQQRQFSFPDLSKPAVRAVAVSLIPASNLQVAIMIRKLKSGEYRLYSRKKDAKTGKRRNLGTFASREKAEAHERAVQYFKRH
jgi:hypothetical protein